jgi:hypothetical protein
MKLSKYLSALAIAGACSTSLSAATLSFNLAESGSDVVLTISGSISSLTNWGSLFAYNNSLAVIRPMNGFLSVYKALPDI